MTLVVKLILDGVEVDEVAHACARVPSHVVCVHVDFSEELDHFVSVCDVGLCARCGSGQAGSAFILAIGLGGGHLGKRKRVGDLEDAVLFHANKASGGGGREQLAARGCDLDCDLFS